jgi:hypothetical protein
LYPCSDIRNTGVLITNNRQATIFSYREHIFLMILPISSCVTKYIARQGGDVCSCATPILIICSSVMLTGQVVFEGKELDAVLVPVL